MTAAPAVIARCPLCEAPGPLGAPCRERVCARQGSHFVPEADARDALTQAPAQREPLIGQFIGDYLITRRLGKGGFGKVLLALQRPAYKLRAAVKLLEFHATDDRSARKVREKFDNEIAALAILQHPNIVRLLQSGDFDGKPFMAMEYIPGSRTLQTEINRLVLGHGTLEPQSIRHILVQMLNGLEAAHEQDLVHRDVKPENIMLQSVVGDPWHVKLVDFGLAKDIAANRDTSMVLGTVPYMSPEQIEGKSLGPWTDCYAVGAIAFELTLGRRPIVGKDSQEILRLKLRPHFDPFADLPGHGLPPAAVQFLQKSLARYPEQRFRSAAEMRAALGALFEDSHATSMFSRDLSKLVDSEDLAHLESEELRLSDQRKALEAEWKKLESARRDLESERVRLGSRELGRPEEVEYIAHGATEHLGASGGLPLIEPTLALPTAPAILPPPSERVEATAALASDALDVTAPPPADLLLAPTPPAPLQTGPPPLAAPPAAPRRRRALAVAAGLVILAGTAAAALLLAPPAPPSPAAPPEVVAEVTPQAEPAPAPTSAPAPAAPAASAPAPPSALAQPASAPEPPQPPAAAPSKAPSPKQTTLEITSTPPGADVFVDGVQVGVTPYLLRARLGAKHKIEVRAKGRAPEIREVLIDREVASLALALKAPSASRPKPPKAPGQPLPNDKPSATTPTYVD